MSTPAAAILFGSISTLADTSELQRQAFNAAFAAHGLGWHWDRSSYTDLLRNSGGEARIAEQASANGEDVDAAAVHRSKSAHFQASLAAGVTARPGVVETVRAAREQGLRLGLVTTTSEENVAALFAGLAPQVRLEDFDVVIDASRVSAPKPDAEAYTAALAALGQTSEECVAIEDNVGGVSSAVSAGVSCVAFPNENTAGHDFSAARNIVDRLELDTLR